MKTSIVVLLLFIVGMFPSNSFGQKQDWKILNQRISQKQDVEKMKESLSEDFNIKYKRTESSYLKPFIGKNLENFNFISKGENKIIFEFKEEKEKLMFSLVNFGWITQKGELIEDLPALSIHGITSSNEKIIPSISIPVNEKVFNVNGVIKFEQPPSNEITIGFSEAISRIEIETSSSQAASVSMGISPLYWSTSDIISNPIVKIPNCQSININVVLDHSSSMDDDEKSDLRKGLIEFMEQEILGEDLKANIAFIEFGKHAQIGMNYLEINEENLSTSGEIYNYLFNIYGQDLENQKQNWTNWESAFELASSLNKVTPANILVLITDGLPNGDFQKRQSSPETIEKTLKYANQIKKGGTHICVVGKDELSGKVGEFWASWVTNKDKLITNKNKDNHNFNIDFFEVNNYQEIGLLENVLIACDKIYDLDLDVELLPENNALLQWPIQTDFTTKNYTVYRSSDKMNWRKLDGSIKSNSNYHTFLDSKTMRGKNYYQIKTTKENFPSLSSSIQMVKLEDEKMFTLFPNPAQKNVEILLANKIVENKETYRIEVKDIFGKNTPYQLVTTSNGYHIKLDNLRSGTYILSLYEQDELVGTEKLVIIK